MRYAASRNNVERRGKDMAKGGLIHFICVRADHAPADGRMHPNTLTIVSGRWAYCPFDALIAGHDWRETEGLTIEAATRIKRASLAV
ncbi:MAG TPA: hypothetical protein VGQ86_08180 [Candidatus Limnocylindria bacterium]|nr:hypothetical protein [Candidatus Limnocylindria bacterium]